MVSRSRNYTHYIGVDVSRNKLDFAVMHGRKLLFCREVQNETLAILSFIKDLKDIDGITFSKVIFGMEQTGIYTNHLLNTLKKVKAHVVLEDSVHIRNSLGKMRGKYDKLDAIRIATYLFRSRDDLKLWQQRRSIIVQLSHLSTLRFRLLTLQNSLKVPLKEQNEFLTPQIVKLHSVLCNDSLIALKNDVAKVDKAILELIASDERLKRLFEIITSVPYVGPVTATQIIVTTNEYLNITDPKKYASYAGVAPFRKESGTAITSARVSPIANKKVKALLHICAMASVSRDSDLKTYYLRKTQEEGKPKMAMLNAIRYKIILRVFACLKQDRLYQKDYVRG
ncbi:transposase [Mucilaginibacter daejeonensis]|uniref:transposase n=1 Tax=Mucilaginibacter daejeonensis TaxID=398049 RepID=UPI001D176053|nr:transposase [Mucilaginibacter daejeonensis]UEG52604.1 transposase [Mucilaginibacter daejeonensis]